MTAEMALRLGQAVAQRFRRARRGARIVIGKDTRLSGYMLESALQAGIVSAGADVLLVGPLPTPGIAFITWSMRADAGVVISASHNPYQDNGIKIFAADGFKLPDEAEAEIERSMEAIGGGHDGARAAPDAIGKAERIDDAVGRYVQFLKHAFPKELTLDGMKIVVDCANGAAYHVAPQVFRELGAEVDEINVWPDGRNINFGCGALHPETMAEEVRRSGRAARHRAGRRRGSGDPRRRARQRHRRRPDHGDPRHADAGEREPPRADGGGDGDVEPRARTGAGRAQRQADTDGGRRSLRRRGDAREGVQAGRRTVRPHRLPRPRDHRRRHHRGAAGAGGDGREQKPLSELARTMTRYPQVLLNFAVARKRPFEEMPAVQKLIAKVESALGGDGRVVVRYSGTESKARVMIEGTDESGIKAYAAEIAESLKQALAG